MKVGVGVGVGTGVNELGNTIDGNGVEKALVELDMTGATDDEIKTFEEAVNKLEVLVPTATSGAVEVEVLEKIRVGITAELEKIVCSVVVLSDIAKKLESSCEVYGNIVSSLGPNPDPAKFHGLSLISHCLTPVYTYS